MTTEKMPEIIFIAGHQKSGKTTTALALRDFLEKDGPANRSKTVLVYDDCVGDNRSLGRREIGLAVNDLATMALPDVLIFVDKTERMNMQMIGIVMMISARLGGRTPSYRVIVCRSGEN